MSASFNPALSLPAHEIEIRGQRIPIRSQGDPEVIAETIATVKAGLRSADSRVKKELAVHHVILLAYLELAEEYVRAKKGLVAYQSEVANQAETLMELIGAESSATGQV